MTAYDSLRTYGPRRLDSDPEIRAAPQDFGSWGLAQVEESAFGKTELLNEIAAPTERFILPLSAYQAGSNDCRRKPPAERRHCSVLACFRQVFFGQWKKEKKEKGRSPLSERQHRRERYLSTPLFHKE